MANDATSPRTQVAMLEQKLNGRVMGGCVYIMVDELHLLLDFAHEGADMQERRATFLALLQRRAPA